MLCSVVGTRRIDMQTDKGDRLTGYSVFLEHDESGVEGVMAEKSFISDSWISGHLGGWVPSVGDFCECSFNRRGKLIVDAPADKR